MLNFGGVFESKFIPRVRYVIAPDIQKMLNETMVKLLLQQMMGDSSDAYIYYLYYIKTKLAKV